MFNRFITTVIFSLLVTANNALAQEAYFISNQFTCFDKPIEAKIKFVEEGDKIVLLWDEHEIDKNQKSFNEYLADKTSGDLVFMRRKTEPFLLVENYSSGAGMVLHRIERDLSKFEYCTPITVTKAPSPLPAYQAYIDQISNANLTAEQLIETIASKSTLWNEKFLSRAEKREIGQQLKDGERSALEGYLDSVTSRLQTAAGDAASSKIILDEVAKTHASIDNRDFRKDLKEAYEKGHDLVARMNFLDGKDPLALAVPTAQEFCTRLDSSLGTSGGTGQLVRASGISMGYWTDDLFDKYANFALDCKEGKAFTRNVDREQKRNARDKELRQGLLVEYNRLMAVPATLSDMRENNWLRLKETKLGGYTINANSVDRFSAERLPARRAELVAPLRAELFEIIETVGDTPLGEYQKLCTQLLGKTDSYNDLGKAVFEGCEKMVLARVEAELVRLAELEPQSAMAAAKADGITDPDRRMVQEYCTKRVLQAPNFAGMHVNKLTPIYSACQTALLESGVSELVTTFVSEAKAILDSPRTLDGLRDNNWYTAPSANEVIEKGSVVNSPTNIRQAAQTYRPLLKAAREEAAQTALAELRTMSKQAVGDQSAASELEQTCQSMPEDAPSELSELSEICDASRAALRAKQAAARCAPMWANTRKTKDMQAGTFVAPKMTGSDSALVQSYFCRAGREDLTYEIIQDVGLFSTDTFIAVTLGGVSGLNGPAVMQAEIVPSKKFDNVYDLVDAKVTGQNGNSIGVKGSGIMLLACFTEPKICQLER